MTNPTMSLIRARIKEEMHEGSTIDVYRLASKLHESWTDIAVDEIANVVTEMVIRGHGNALWNKDIGERVDH